MKRVDIIACGRMRNSPFEGLLEMYQGRSDWPIHFIEIASKHKDPQRIQRDEAERIHQHINTTALICALDERGKEFKSIDFANKLERVMADGQNHMQFIIGGADGLLPEVREKCDFLVSFGRQTWPHMLARVMLMEQIYRSQQIIKGHPYHRE